VPDPAQPLPAFEPGSLVGTTLVFVPAGGAIEGDTLFRRVAAGISDQHAAGNVFEPAHPQRRAEFAADPTGQAHVVGMHVRADHARDRLALERLVENLAPIFARLFERDAGVDNGPAFAVLDQPEIDRLQHERQRHANPMHAGRNLARLAWFGRFAQRINQLRLGGPGFRYVCVVNAIHGHGASLVAEPGGG
jgi:hypothetical protein